MALQGETTEKPTAARIGSRRDGPTAMKVDSMADIDIPLSEIPERLFDPEKWARVIHWYSGRREALEALGQREPGLLLYTAEQAANRGHLRSQLTLSVLRTKETLVAEFKAKLAEGHLVVTALQPPDLARVTIPAGIWDNLQPDFVRNSAVGAGFSFVDIRVSEAAAAPAQDEAIAACISWLAARRQSHGDEMKKVLQKAAAEHFGTRLTTRQFDQAYAAVYQRGRGRPRGAPEK